MVERAEHRESDVTTDGQSEESLSSLAGANGAVGSVEPGLDPEAVGSQLGLDLGPASLEVIADVLNDENRGPARAHDSSDVRPEVALVGGAEALAGLAEWLTRVACRDDIHDATPALAVEGGNVVPGRSRIQGLLRHAGHENGRGEGVPLTHGHKTGSAGEGSADAELEAADPGAEGKHVGGR